MATIIKENKDLPTDSPYKFDNIGGKSQMENKPLAEPTANTNQIPAPVSTPKVEVPTSLSTSQLSKTTTQPQVVDNSGVIKNIQNTLTKYTAEAGANEDFIKGAIKASGQVETPELLAQYKGKKLGDVISGLGLGEKVGYTATPSPTIAPEANKGTSGAPSQAEWENAGNTGVAPFSPKTALQKLQDIQNEYSSSTAENVANQGVVSEYQAKANEAQANIQALDEQQSALGAKNSLEALGLKNDFLDFQKNLDQAGAETSRNKGIILGDEQSRVNFDLSKLSIEDGKNLANYTLARIPLVQNYNIAKGNYDAASTYAKNVADAYEKSAKFQLDVLAMQNSISQQDKTALQSQITNEINYMKEGMTAIDDNQLEKIKADIISGKTNGATLWTDPVTGKNWLKPSVEDETNKSLVADMAGKYVDAGIMPTDTLAVAQSKIKNSKIYQDQVRGPVGTSGGGTISGVTADGWVKLLSTGQATIANVPTNIRNQVISALASSGQDIKDKMSQADITKITDYQAGLSSLDELRNIVLENSEYVGPISGWQALNPWSEARKVQANIDKVKQTVGKALEGGVLRKEDEEKYKKILATITDTPSTATYKLDSLKSSLERDLANYISTIQGAGRYVAGQEQPSALDLEGLRNKYKY